MSEATEALKVDRSGWSPGPWDSEPDKANWMTAAGLPGMIVRNTNGSLCGYVAVTSEHPWFGRRYGDDEGIPMAPDCAIEVHGGLTYSARCAGHICHVPEPGQPDDVWWFGFDCNHSWDRSPGNDAFDRKMGWGSLREERSAYRDVAYVRSEVESLARQLAAVAPSDTSRTASEEK